MNNIFKKILLIFLSSLCLLSAGYSTTIINNTWDNGPEGLSIYYSIDSSANNPYYSNGEVRLGDHINTGGGDLTRLFNPNANLNLTNQVYNIEYKFRFVGNSYNWADYQDISFGFGENINSNKINGFYVLCRGTSGTPACFVQYFDNTGAETQKAIFNNVANWGDLTGNTNYIININLWTNTNYIINITLKDSNNNVIDTINNIDTGLSSSYDNLDYFLENDNQGNSYTYIDYLTITSNSITTSTPIINHNVQKYYNSSSISIALNTTSNVNMSYLLDNASLISICTNCNQTTLNLNSLSEGTHSILFESKNVNGNVNITANFTIDTIKPNISQLPVEITNNSLNFTNYCNDLNLNSCSIEINNQTYQNNDLIQFQQAKEYNYTIIATDKANNSNSLNGSILFNPYVSFYVYDTKRKINLSNYYLNAIQSPYSLINGTYYYDKITKLKYFNIPEQIKVSKSLYPTTIYNITNSQKDLGLIQLNLTPATISINLYDYDTKSLLTNWSINIRKNDILYLSKSNLSNFSEYYSNDISGKLNIELLKNGYFTSYLNPSLDINSSISHDVYLVSSANPKIFPLEVKDRSGTKYLSDVVISVYVTQNGKADEYFTTQVKTDSTGKVYLFLDSTKNYKLVLTKDNYVRTIEYITPTDYQLTFYMAAKTKDYSFDYVGFTYLIKQVNLSNTNVTEFSCYYEDSELKINSVQCSVTRSYDTLFYLETTSTNSLSDNLILSTPRTLTYRDYKVHMRVIRSGKEYNFYK